MWKCQYDDRFYMKTHFIYKSVTFDRQTTNRPNAPKLDYHIDKLQQNNCNFAIYLIDFDRIIGGQMSVSYIC